MLRLIVLAFIIFLFYSCVPLRLCVTNILQTIKYSIKDVYLYVKRKDWNVAKCGFIDCYCGLFGYGKTLSAVHYVTKYYRRYNDRLIYDRFQGRFVRQYIQVLSNVELNIPYTKFVSMDQIVDIAEHVAEFNAANDCKLMTIVLGDEFSVQMNSRNFKSNLTAPVLNSILTCRHHGISMVLTSQRFAHMDALLRQVTSRVIECRKLWRLQCQSEYDAWDLEQAGTSLKLKPIRRTGFFVRDEDYNAYSSIAVVENLIRDYKDGNLFDEDTILRLQGGQDPDRDAARSLKRKYRRKKNSA